MRITNNIRQSCSQGGISTKISTREIFFAVD